MKLTKRHISAALFSAFISSTAWATDGYFSPGYGVKSLGMGGVGVAFPQDGLASAYNPAGIGLVDDQFNVGLSIFRIDRSAEIVDNGIPGVNGNYDGNGTKYFFIPEVGYVKRLSNSTTLGFAMYGNGGMNTDYSKNPFAAFGSTGNASINLMQVFLKPTVAYKLNEQNTFGVGINFAYQRFSAHGLQAFASASVHPDNVSNKGVDSSMGLGIHLGWIGQITPDFSVGATWTSKTYMDKFDKYKGLFADDGSFDIPSHFAIGAAYKATPALTLAADIQRINYGNVKSIANPLSNLFAGNPLGSGNGPGFGWRDVTVVKVGASYEVNPDLTLRIGYNHTSNPVPADQTFFNILAPAVVRDHMSIGGSWKTSPTSEWSAFYMHTFKKETNGVNSIPAAFGGGNANLNMRQDLIGVSYTGKL